MEPRRRKAISRSVSVGAALVALGVVLFVLFAGRSSRRAGPPARADRETVVLEGTQGAFPACSDCHQDLDRRLRRGKVENLTYTHEEHFATGAADCAACHPNVTHGPDKLALPTMGRCFECHGLGESATASGECSTCHPPDMRQEPASHRASGWALHEHARHAVEEKSECLTCHNTEEFCTSCHGVEMPHQEDWKQTPHVAAFFDEGASVCENCHMRGPDIPDSCDSCHHPEGSEAVAWPKYHPKVVKRQGGDQCMECHAPVTCASCHVSGRETFRADKAKVLPPS